MTAVNKEMRNTIRILEQSCFGLEEDNKQNGRGRNNRRRASNSKGDITYIKFINMKKAAQNTNGAPLLFRKLNYQNN